MRTMIVTHSPPMEVQVGLADRYLEPGGGGGASPAFSCPHYEALDGSKRCRHYVAGGACDRPDELMCVEWLKANGQSASGEPEAAEPKEARPAPDDGVDRDLFGNPIEAPSPPKKPPRNESPTASTATTPAPPPQDDAPLVRNLTDEEIASFKELGVEVCLATESCGDLWLVPEYTGRDDRLEMRIDHAATLTAICAAFPGAKVRSIERDEGKSPDNDTAGVPPG